ncbi:hypothetical protein BOTCAL_0064g00020 [Botryotinia calthae]|uniref:Uncharacterized protein n=1 Tax=Botryotinia calthae TaxID=38488 RepID=A0A4Y8D9H2_9HELO|nr:hypothetical protein BOTCAL_0064g00020 [Botryotinia calthae]
MDRLGMISDHPAHEGFWLINEGQCISAKRDRNDDEAFVEEERSNERRSTTRLRAWSVGGRRCGN